MGKRKKQTWSWSRVTCFEDCPYRWFLKYVDQTKGASKFYADFGSYVHHLLEGYYSGYFTADELPVEFLIGVNSVTENARPSAKTTASTVREVFEYFNSFEPIDVDPVATEMELRFDLGGNSFVGFIDLLGEKDGELYIIDHKSRKLKPPSSRKTPTKNDEEIDLMLRQLYLYSAGVKEKYGRFPDWLCFNCFKNGVFIKHRFDLQKYESTVAWVTEKIKEIEGTKVYHPLPEFFKCRYICDVSHECIYAEGGNN